MWDVVQRVECGGVMVLSMMVMIIVVVDRCWHGCVIHWIIEGHTIHFSPSPGRQSIKQESESLLQGAGKYTLSRPWTLASEVEEAFEWHNFDFDKDVLLDAIHMLLNACFLLRWQWHHVI